MRIWDPAGAHGPPQGSPRAPAHLLALLFLPGIGAAARRPSSSASCPSAASDPHLAAASWSRWKPIPRGQPWQNLARRPRAPAPAQLPLFLCAAAAAPAVRICTQKGIQCPARGSSRWGWSQLHTMPPVSSPRRPRDTAALCAPRALCALHSRSQRAPRWGQLLRGPSHRLLCPPQRDGQDQRNRPEMATAVLGPPSTCRAALRAQPGPGTCPAGTELLASAGQRWPCSEQRALALRQQQGLMRSMDALWAPVASATATRLRRQASVPVHRAAD